MRLRHFPALLLILVVCPVPVFPAEPPPPTADDVLKYLGFDAEARADLAAGKIISRGFKEGSDRELSIAVAMQLALPLEETFKAVQEGKTFRVDEQIIAFRDMGAVPDRGSLAEIGFGRDESAEVRLLLRLEPGTTYNLDTNEIAQFRELRRKFPARDAERDPACFAAANELYRQVLWRRMESYRKKGLDGIAPYARGPKPAIDVAQDIRGAVQSASAFLQPHFPAFVRVFEKYPEASSESVEHRYFWVKQLVNKRPAFILIHRMSLKRPDGALVVDRQFYVGHSYNCLQLIAGCLPDGDNTLVFYTNRTSTDQVAGFSSGLKHVIGRNMMKDEIVAWFDSMRKGIGKK